MECFDQAQGSHAVASRSGQYVACVSNGRLRIHAIASPENFSEVPIRIASKDVQTVTWNDKNICIAILSHSHIEVVDLNDSGHRVRLDNGTAGLGKFASVEFIGAEHLLVTWEFGKAKVYDLNTAKSVELADVKTTCIGPALQTRPDDGNAQRQTLATLTRPGADDSLSIDFPILQKTLLAIKLPTTDAQSLSWAPDGRWLAVLDTPTARPSVHFHTPSGHLYRSYPSKIEDPSSGLGIKSVVWSSNSQAVALTKYDGKIVLLNTRTFIPLAIIEHTMTIDQTSLQTEQRALVWQETVSAAGDRSYTTPAQPVSPPLTRTKPSTEPSEMGVAEASFSCNGSYLATRDERMLNTVWIWNMATLGAHAVVIQHSNIRRSQWHPSRHSTLLLHCGEGVAYVLDVMSTQPPLPCAASFSGSPSLSWIHTSDDAALCILAATRTSFKILYPEGRPEINAVEAARGDGAEAETYEEGTSEDSLLDLLSGRTPLPQKTQPSYTEMVDVEVETEEEGSTMRMEDTFVGKNKKSRPVPVDPLDASDIF